MNGKPDIVFFHFTVSTFGLFELLQFRVSAAGTDFPDLHFGFPVRVADERLLWEIAGVGRATAKGFHCFNS